jgi:hypothetical protein
MTHGREDKRREAEREARARQEWAELRELQRAARISREGFYIIPRITAGVR